jgi:hypothetical protein
VLFQGIGGQDPTAEEAQTVAEECTNPEEPDENFPVVFKPLLRMQAALPHSNRTPNICIIGPEREILMCVDGHAREEMVKAFIRDHWEG